MQECPVCYETYGPGTALKTVASFECSHTLCNVCDRQLYNRHDNRCPCCRAERVEKKSESLEVSDGWESLDHALRVLASSSIQRSVTDRRDSIPLRRQTRVLLTINIDNFIETQLSPTSTVLEDTESTATSRNNALNRRFLRFFRIHG